MIGGPARFIAHEATSMALESSRCSPERLQESLHVKGQTGLMHSIHHRWWRVVRDGVSRESSAHGPQGVRGLYPLTNGTARSRRRRTESTVASLEQAHQVM